MALLHQFKFQERFFGENFIKFISIKEYNRVYRPKVTNPHTHNYYLLMFITKGSGKHFIDFKEYPIHKNAIYFIAPGQVHHMHRSSDTDGFDIIFEEEFFCSGVTKNEIILPPPFFRNGLISPYLNLTDLDSTNMLSLFQRVKTEYTNQDIERWEIIRAILNILINRIEHISSTNKSKVYPKYKQAFKIMNDFRDLVEQSFATEKCVSFYADKLNITKNHLTETIREVSGKTPLDTIRRRTLLEARRILFEDKISIKEVSFRLGYENPSYFIKVFKEETGFTPREFRNMAGLRNNLNVK